MLKHKKAIVCAVVAVLVSAIFVTAAVTPKKEKVENTQYNSDMITEYEVSSNRHTKFVFCIPSRIKPIPKPHTEYEVMVLNRKWKVIFYPFGTIRMKNLYV